MSDEIIGGNSGGNGAGATASEEAGGSGYVEEVAGSSGLIQEGGSGSTWSTESTCANCDTESSGDWIIKEDSGGDESCISLKDEEGGSFGVKPLVISGFGIIEQTLLSSSSGSAEREANMSDETIGGISGGDGAGATASEEAGGSGYVEEVAGSSGLFQEGPSRFTWSTDSTGANCDTETGDWIIKEDSGGDESCISLKDEEGGSFGVKPLVISGFGIIEQTLLSSSSGSAEREANMSDETIGGISGGDGAGATASEEAGGSGYVEEVAGSSGLFQEGASRFTWSTDSTGANCDTETGDWIIKQDSGGDESCISLKDEEGGSFGVKPPDSSGYRIIEQTLLSSSSGSAEREANMSDETIGGISGGDGAGTTASEEAGGSGYVEEVAGSSGLIQEGASGFTWSTESTGANCDTETSGEWIIKEDSGGDESCISLKDEEGGSFGVKPPVSSGFRVTEQTLLSSSSGSAEREANMSDETIGGISGGDGAGATASEEAGGSGYVEEVAGSSGLFQEGASRFTWSTDSTGANCDTETGDWIIKQDSGGDESCISLKDEEGGSFGVKPPVNSGYRIIEQTLLSSSSGSAEREANMSDETIGGISGGDGAGTTASEEAGGNGYVEEVAGSSGLIQEGASGFTWSTESTGANCDTETGDWIIKQDSGGDESCISLKDEEGGSFGVKPPDSSGYRIIEQTLLSSSSGSAEREANMSDETIGGISGGDGAGATASEEAGGSGYVEEVAGSSGLFQEGASRFTWSTDSTGANCDTETGDWIIKQDSGGDESCISLKDEEGGSFGVKPPVSSGFRVTEQTLLSSSSGSAEREANMSDETIGGISGGNGAGTTASEEAGGSGYVEEVAGSSGLIQEGASGFTWSTESTGANCDTETSGEWIIKEDSGGDESCISLKDEEGGSFGVKPPVSSGFRVTEQTLLSSSSGSAEREANMSDETIGGISGGDGAGATASEEAGGSGYVEEVAGSSGLFQEGASRFTWSTDSTGANCDTETSGDWIIKEDSGGDESCISLKDEEGGSFGVKPPVSSGFRVTEQTLLSSSSGSAEREANMSDETIGGISGGDGAGATASEEASGSGYVEEVAGSSGLFQEGASRFTWSTDSTGANCDTETGDWIIKQDSGGDESCISLKDEEGGSFGVKPPVNSGYRIIEQTLLSSSSGSAEREANMSDETIGGISGGDGAGTTASEEAGGNGYVEEVAGSSGLIQEGASGFTWSTESTGANCDTETSGEWIIKEDSGGDESCISLKDEEGGSFGVKPPVSSGFRVTEQTLLSSSSGSAEREANMSDETIGGISGGDGAGATASEEAGGSGYVEEVAGSSGLFQEGASGFTWSTDSTGANCDTETSGDWIIKEDSGGDESCISLKDEEGGSFGVKPPVSSGFRITEQTLLSSSSGSAEREANMSDETIGGISGGDGAGATASEEAGGSGYVEEVAGSSGLFQEGPSRFTWSTDSTGANCDTETGDWIIKQDSGGDESCISLKDEEGDNNEDENSDCRTIVNSVLSDCKQFEQLLTAVATCSNRPGEANLEALIEKLALENNVMITNQSGNESSEFNPSPPKQPRSAFRKLFKLYLREIHGVVTARITRGQVNPGDASVTLFTNPETNEDDMVIKRY